MLCLKIWTKSKIDMNLKDTITCSRFHDVDLIFKINLKMYSSESRWCLIFCFDFTRLSEFCTERWIQRTPSSKRWPARCRHVQWRRAKALLPAGNQLCCSLQTDCAAGYQRDARYQLHKPVQASPVRGAASRSVNPMVVATWVVDVPNESKN